MDGPFAVLTVSREGRSLVEWLDENLAELEQRSNRLAKLVATGRFPSETFLCAEQLRLAIEAVRTVV